MEHAIEKEGPDTFSGLPKSTAIHPRFTLSENRYYVSFTYKCSCGRTHDGSVKIPAYNEDGLYYPTEPKRTAVEEQKNIQICQIRTAVKVTKHPLL
jgi:hypothetical protein